MGQVESRWLSQISDRRRQTAAQEGEATPIPPPALDQRGGILFQNHPNQSRGLAATAKYSRSETGYTIRRDTSRALVAGRLPGGAVYSRARVRETCQVWIRRSRNQSGLNSGLLLKRAISPKTGYVPAGNSRQVPSPIHFPNTDQKLARQLPAVGLQADDAKGLATGGNKPLMRNHMAPMICASATGITAGNTFSSASTDNQSNGETPCPLDAQAPIDRSHRAVQPSVWLQNRNRITASKPPCPEPSMSSAPSELIKPAALRA